MPRAPHSVRVLGVKRRYGIPLLALIFVLLTLSFASNLFGVAPQDRWTTWELGSEVMVLKRIEADLVNRSVTPLGLGAYAGDDLSAYSRLKPQNLPRLDESVPEQFVAYRSEAGGYSRALSFAWRQLACSSVTCLHVLNAGLLSASVILVGVGVGFIGSAGLGWSVIVSMGLSPWITMAARNLFWSPWLYLLPSLSVLLWMLVRKRYLRILAAAVVPLAFFVKFWGSGYREFITITIMAMSMPIIAWLFGSVGGRRSTAQAAFVVASAVAAMLAALVVHAQWMASSVPAGLQEIWRETVLRRTYGDASNFIPAYEPGLTANPLTVVWQYIGPSWSTNLFAFGYDQAGSLWMLEIGPTAFRLLLLAALLVPIWRLLARDPKWRQDAILLALGISSTVLWFLAAKGYSFVHTHLLFFVWYLFTIPVLLFVVGRKAWELWSYYRFKKVGDLASRTADQRLPLP